MNALEAGGTLGGYRILARLRAGAMGVLYLARRIAPAGFSRPVAIKVIHDHLAANSRFVRMFVDEAKLSARIDDPNVVRIEEFGSAGGRYYLVMEYVHGASLAQTLAVLRRRGGVPLEHAVAIAMQIASGLHGAHEATDEDGAPLGIVHRDVSPHNVLLSYKGAVRVIDFGIAKAKHVGGQTKTGSLRGKLAYMPPEQARSARTVDRRADLYGVGLVLWEMLTRRRVFDADTDIAILNQIRNPQIAPPSTIAARVPKALDELVMRTLANDPQDRPQTGLALQRALAAALPAALHVLPADLAALMNDVRAAATAAEGADDDDDDDDDDESSTTYGDEVRGTLRTFGSSMSESVELADSLGSSRASSPELEEPARPAPVSAVRPGDGVRPIPLPPPSSPDLGPHAPAPSRPSFGDARPGSLADAALAAAATAAPDASQSLTGKQKILLAVGAPVLGGMLIASFMFGEQSHARTTAPPRVAVRDAAAELAPREPPPLRAPVVIAPPEVPPDAPDAARKPRPVPRTRHSAVK